MLHIPNISLFILTFLSGTIAFALQRKNAGSVRLLLAFSGAFLLATCVLHLLPEIFEESEIQAAPFILLGFFVQILIDFISQGMEHGHIHPQEDKSSFPFLIYLGLCIHAFTEGLPLAGIPPDGLTSLPPLYWGILLHKIPIALILVTLLLSNGVRPVPIFLSLTIFSLMAPLGGLIGNFVVKNASESLMVYFLAIATGIFLHISTVILFESSHNHKFNLLKFVFIVSGGVLAVILF